MARETVSAAYLLEAQKAFDGSPCNDWESFLDGYMARDRLMTEAMLKGIDKAFGGDIYLREGPVDAQTKVPDDY